MRGFQPGKARAVPQNYADGGVVSTIKGMLGFGGGTKKPEPLPADLNKMPPTGAGPAASQPEPPKKAISQYSGMSALERRMKEAGAYADGGLVRTISDAVRPFSESVGGYWSNSNKEFEATNPGVGERFGRALNPVTGFGSAVGAMYDAAGNGSARDAAIAAAQAAPMFAAMKAVPAAKSLIPTAPQIAVATGKTAAKAAGGTGAGVAADEVQARGFANGGLVRGPGTGISDDIEDEVEDGTFIMPADSTEVVGPEVMDQAGKAVPVNLSNGETKLPPEALQAIGAQVMEAIKDVTHVPAAKQARGFPMGEHAGPELDDDDGRMNFADGGVVDDKRRPRTVADLARSPGYGAGAGGPVSTSVRPQPQAARPQASQPMPGVTRQGNSYSATPAQGPLGSGMYQLDSNLPKPPNIQAQAQRPAPTPAQRSPAPAPTQPVQQTVQNPAQPRPTYTGSTVADRARSPAFGMGAGAYTPKPAAQVAQAAQQPAPAATTAAQVVRAGNSVSVAPRPAAAPAPSIAARVAPQAGGASGSWEAKPSAVPANVPSTSPAKDAGGPNYASHPDMPTYGSDGVGKAFSAIGDGIGWLAKTAVSAPGYGFSRDDKQAAPATAAASSAPSAAQKLAAAPAASPAATQPKPEAGKPSATGAAATSGAKEIMPGVYRQGNSYGDSPEAAASGARPSQGPSAQNQSIAAALAQRSGQRPDQPADVMGIYARASEALKGVAEARRALDEYGPGSVGQGGGTYIKHSGNDWETEKNLKNLRTSASSITNRPGRRGEPSVEQQAYLKALDADMAARSGNNPAAIEAMRQQGETARFNAREAGENTRAGMRNTADARRDSIAAQLAQGKLDLERTAQGYANRSADRQEKLYAEYDAAKTPEERATIAQKIRDLSGKNSQDGRYQLVRGEQVFDEKANALRNTGERLYDTQAGRFVDGGISVQAQAMPERQDQLKAGQVYETSRGPARWDGKQFTAVAG